MSQDQPQSSTLGRADAIWIVALFIAAAGLRLTGSGYGLPWIEEPDADSLLMARGLALGSLGPEALLEPTRYPHLLVYLLVPLYKLFPAVDFVWIGRVLSGLLGAGTVVFSFLCARRVGGCRAAVLAGLMVCFSFLSVQHSHLAKPHIHVAFFTIAAIYFCMRIASDARTRDYLLAGLMGGAALAVLHSGLVVLPCLITAVMIAPGKGRALSLKRYLDRDALILWAFLVLFLLAGYPNRLAALFKIAGGSADWSLLMAPHTEGATQSLGLAGYGRVPQFLLQYAPLAAILGLFALIFGLLRRRPSARPLLPGWILVFCFLALFGHVQSFVPRFLLLILPFLSVAGAVWLAAVSRKLGTFPFALLCLVLLLPGAALCLKLDALFLTTDTREQAVQWIEEQIPPSVPLVAVTYLDFPLPLTRDAILAHKKAVKDLPRWEREHLSILNRGDEDPWRGKRYNVFFPFDKGRWTAGRAERLAFIRKNRTPFALSVFYEPFQVDYPSYNAFTPLGETLFRAVPDRRLVCANLFQVPLPYWYLWTVERPGPTVVITRLPGP